MLFVFIKSFFIDFISSRSSSWFVSNFRFFNKLLCTSFLNVEIHRPSNHLLSSDFLHSFFNPHFVSKIRPNSKKLITLTNKVVCAKNKYPNTKFSCFFICSYAPFVELLIHFFFEIDTTFFRAPRKYPQFAGR